MGLVNRGVGDLNADGFDDFLISKNANDRSSPLPIWFLVMTLQASQQASLICLTPRLKQPVCLMLQAQGLTA